MIVRELQKFLKYLQRNLMKIEPFVKELKMFVKMSEDPNALIRKKQLSFNPLVSRLSLQILFLANAQKYYGQLLSPFVKLWVPFLECVMRVGGVECHACHVTVM